MPARALGSWPRRFGLCALLTAERAMLPRLTRAELMSAVLAGIDSRSGIRLYHSCSQTFPRPLFPFALFRPERARRLTLVLASLYDFVIQEVPDETHACADHSLTPLESCRKLRKAGQGRIKKQKSAVQGDAHGL